MSASQTPPSFTNPPTPPQRSDSANFAARGDTFLSWIGTALISEMRSALTWMSAAMSDALAAMYSASTSASTATTKASDASTSAANAASSASAAATSASTASTKASDASTSATAAAASAAAAAASAGSVSTVTETSTQSLSNKTMVGLMEKSIDLGAGSSINLSTGNHFSKTISAATTLSLTSVPASGTLMTFLLDLTNGGAYTVTWWSGIKWESGTAPTLTSSGRDVIGFYTRDGGTTWTGLVKKDVR